MDELSLPKPTVQESRLTTDGRPSRDIFSKCYSKSGTFGAQRAAGDS